MGYKIYRGGKYAGTDSNYVTKYKAVAVDSNGVKTIVTVNANTKDQAFRIIKKTYSNTEKKWVRPETKFDTSGVLNSANINSVSDKFIDKAVGAEKKKAKNK